MPIHVLCVGCGNPIPSFIMRRLNALVKQGVHITVILDYGYRPVLDNRIQIIRQYAAKKMRLSHYVHLIVVSLLHIRILFSVWRLLRNFSFSTRIKKTIVNFPMALAGRVDVIHLQWLSLAHSHAWLRQHYHAPVVASVRGSQVTVYPITRNGYDENIKKCFQSADAFHLVSNGLISYCEALGAQPDRLFVNYNGIPLDMFDPAETPTHNEGISIISVGALIWRKGYEYQLLILKHLVESGIEATLTVVGSGPALEGLYYITHRFGLTNRVFFSGQLPQGEVIQLLRKSSVYLSTSFAEGLPNSLVEAAACGLPIVAFDCDGADEIIDHGETGYIVPVGDIEGATKCLVQVSETSVRERMSKMARLKMVKEFDEHVWVARMKQEYQRIKESYV